MNMITLLAHAARYNYSLCLACATASFQSPSLCLSLSLYPSRSPSLSLSLSFALSLSLILLWSVLTSQNHIWLQLFVLAVAKAADQARGNAFTQDMPP